MNFDIGSTIVEEVVPVTVCIAAMCYTEGTFVAIGASDRMVTAGDVQFEPRQTKVWELTNSITAMTAGDSLLQTEILSAVLREMGSRILAAPTTWLLVRDVAQIYSQHYQEAKRMRSENAILAPLGLTHETFIQRQQGMSDSLVRQLATELINYSVPAVATIFTGVDPEGTHIYVTNEGDVRCHDNIGFAAIGAGRWHANSQFMFAQHSRFKPVPETLLLTYASKKRAEVSPGVGEETDMFTVGPQVGSYVKIPDNVLTDFEKMHKTRISREKKASEKANQEVVKYVQNLAAAATPKEQEVSPQDSGGNPPTDQG